MSSPTAELDEFAQDKAQSAGGALLERKVRSKADRAGVERKDDKLTVTGEPGELADIPEMLRRRNLNPDHWIVERAVVNEWESSAMVAGDWISTTLHQLKIFLKAKSASVLVQPVACEGVAFSQGDPGGAAVNGGAVLAVVLGDQQVRGPGLGYDPQLHEFVLRWLDENRPNRAVIGGDLLDSLAFSRFAKSLSERVGAQAEVRAGHALVHGYVEAAGQCCEWDYLEGNHEAHIRRAIREKLPEAEELTIAGRPDGVPIWSTRSLLDLDALGVRMDPSEWPHGQVKLSPYLGVRHGWIVRKASGGSAYATLDHLGHSVIVCHTHRKGTAYQTKHEMGGGQRVNVAIENGTLAKVAGGLGYAVSPDWQNGFTVVRLQPDGTFTYSDAIYANGSLLWEGQRYSMKRGKVIVEL